MNSSDGKSVAPPLRKRKSKRFDRSGTKQRLGGSPGEEIESSPAVEAVEADATTGKSRVAAKPEPTLDQTNPETTPDETTLNEATVNETGPSSTTEDADAAAEPSEKPKAPAFRSTAKQAAPATKAPPGASVVIDGAVRSRTLDERQACGRCGHELSMVNIEVDGNVLIMESCDNCDARRWHLAGEPIELQQVLDHVGEHAGRRR